MSSLPQSPLEERPVPDAPALAAPTPAGIALDPPPSGAPDGRRVRRILVGVAALLASAAGLAVLGTGIAYEPLPLEASAEPEQGVAPPRELERLKSHLRRMVPRGPYVIIDQTHNRLRLMRGEEQLLEAPCSAGSGMVLREGSGGRVWTFDTPRGAFRVQSRLVNPVWRKPDWAFLEEGKPIPSDPAERFEYGVLGAYALYFGNGYLIHGTLYERLIGRPVSHGCIRVGREPLEKLYRALPVGAPVLIF